MLIRFVSEIKNKTVAGAVLGAAFFLFVFILVAMVSVTFWVLGQSFEIFTVFLTVSAIFTAAIVSVLGYPWIDLLYDDHTTLGFTLFAICISLLINFVILGAIFGRFILRHET